MRLPHEHPLGSHAVRPPCTVFTQLMHRQSSRTSCATSRCRKPVAARPESVSRFSTTSLASRPAGEIASHLCLLRTRAPFRLLGGSSSGGWSAQRLVRRTASHGRSGGCGQHGSRVGWRTAQRTHITIWRRRSPQRGRDVVHFAGSWVRLIVSCSRPSEWTILRDGSAPARTPHTTTHRSVACGAPAARGAAPPPVRVRGSPSYLSGLLTVLAFNSHYNRVS